MRISKVRIETILAERQMTLQQLSTASGIAKQNISTIIRRGSCYPKTAGKLARGLQVAVAEITEEISA